MNEPPKQKNETQKEEKKVRLRTGLRAGVGGPLLGHPGGPIGPGG